MVDDLFQRQRRNLVLMSTLVLFINLTGGELQKISLLGNELVLKDTSALPNLLAVVMGYFLLRFAQYAHDIENKGFRDRFFKRVEYYLAPYLLKRTYFDPRADLRKHYPKLEDIEVHEPVAMFNDAMPDNKAAVSFVGKPGGLVMDYHDLHVSNWELVVPFVRAGVYLCIRTRLVTDYVFPVALSISAFASFIKQVPPLWTFAS